MSKKRGFTLVELMVTMAIIGILFATAVPVYQTWMHRTRGAEAAVMLKQITEAQILYFLDHDKFFPEGEENTIEIYHDTPTDDPEITRIADNLNIIIPSGHFLEFYFAAINDIPGDESFTMTVRSHNDQFDIFKGTSIVTASLNKDGDVEYIYPSY